jgi:hypothetical protein
MVVVSVSSTKIALADTAATAALVAIGFLIAAALAAAHIISFIGAAVALALAGIAEAVSLGAGGFALDPPVPDFKYHESVAIIPTVFPQQVNALPKGLQTTFELVARILASLGALSQIEGKLIGAAIDGDLDGLRLQTASQEQALRIVALAAAHLPMAVSDAVAGLRADSLFAPLFAAARQRAVLRRWRRSGVDENVRLLWRAEGLPNERLVDLERAIASFDIPVESVDDLLTRLAQALQQVAEGVDRESRRLRADLEQGLASDAVRVLRSQLQSE